MLKRDPVSSNRRSKRGLGQVVTVLAYRDEAFFEVKCVWVLCC